MSPRAYRSDKRTTAAEETRLRMLAAARALLSGASTTQVSVDAVAKAADVSRQTVYNAFGTKSGLLEALFDDLVGKAGMGLEAAFTAPDLDTALARFTEAFCAFWGSDRLVIRRLHGMAVTDRVLDRLLRERNEMRRTALTRLLDRFGAAPGAGTVDVIWQLTGFESYDALAGRHGERGTAEVARVIAAAAITLHAGTA